MNVEWKKKWVEALRSGDYEKCTGALRLKNVGFCCLGVLCDIMTRGTWENTLSNSMRYIDNSEGLPGALTTLPGFVQEIVGLSDEDPTVRDKETDTDRTLIEHNDSGSSFKQIADLIEEQL